MNLLLVHKILCNKLPSAVPGVVFNLMADFEFNSIVLTWIPPREPNGVIIGYEVTYRVNENNITHVNSIHATNFSIRGIIPRATVSDISVSAYTSAGLGEAAVHPDLLTPDDQLIPRKFIVATSFGRGKHQTLIYTEMRYSLLS